MTDPMIHKPDPKYPDTHLDFRNELNNLRIDIKWDGCVNIDSYCNGDTVEQHHADNHDYIHICDLPTFIAQLQQVLEAARKQGFEV
jgi:hypothetical protein